MINYYNKNNQFMSISKHSINIANSRQSANDANGHQAKTVPTVNVVIPPVSTNKATKKSFQIGRRAPSTTDIKALEKLIQNSAGSQKNDTIEGVDEYRQIN